MEWWMWATPLGLCLFALYMALITAQDGDKVYIARICPIHNPDCHATYRLIVPVSECDVCNAQR